MKGALGIKVMRFRRIVLVNRMYPHGHRRRIRGLCEGSWIPLTCTESDDETVWAVFLQQGQHAWAARDPGHPGHLADDLLVAGICRPAQQPRGAVRHPAGTAEEPTWTAGNRLDTRSLVSSPEGRCRGRAAGHHRRSRWCGYGPGNGPQPTSARCPSRQVQNTGGSFRGGRLSWRPEGQYTPHMPSIETSSTRSSASTSDPSWSDSVVSSNSVVSSSLWAVSVMTCSPLSETACGCSVRDDTGTQCRRGGYVSDFVRQAGAASRPTPTTRPMSSPTGTACRSF